jgi:hypothetical protein
MGGGILEVIDVRLNVNAIDAVDGSPVSLMKRELDIGLAELILLKLLVASPCRVRSMAAGY